MSTLAFNVPLFSVPDLLGAAIMTMALAFVLYGITITQVYIYYTSKNNDASWIKATVATVFIIESAHTVLLFRLMYFYCVIAFGDYLAVLQIDWPVGWVLITEDCIVLLVEGFYLWRIWLLSKRNKIVVGTLSLALAFRLGIYAATGGMLIKGKDWLSFEASHINSVVVNISAIMAAAVDGLVAIAMVYYLYTSGAEIKRSQGLVQWLVAYSINSGLILVVISVAVAITHIRLNRSLVFAGLTTLGSKLYANTFLGTLNARDRIRSRTDPGTVRDISLSSSPSNTWGKGRAGDSSRSDGTDTIGPMNFANRSTFTDA
ncbi:hypothetical protein K474DRAFT_1667252 [Panus rudis PR-1116 ss-1]|nr:hypothetical protein K474DRAFT_1667252 [Panus rudis PR-1116 ss-1]